MPSFNLMKTFHDDGCKFVQPKVIANLNKMQVCIYFKRI